MADKKERICVVCNKHYSYCPRCKEDRNKELWHFTFHELNCKEIYNVLSAYEDGRLSANDAKTQLENLDLSKVDNFGESYKNTISKIRAELDKSDVPVKEDIETVSVEEIVENEPTVEWVQSVPEVENTDETDETKVTDENTNKGKNYRKSKNKIYSDVE
jgi:hypothetical protein